MPQRITLLNGAAIEFRSWERPGGLYGPTIAGAVVDEFGQLDEEGYAALSSRRAETITRGFGSYRFYGNVGPVGGYAEKLWKLAIRGEDSTIAAFRWTWFDRALSHECGCDVEDAMSIEHGHEHAPACGRGEYIRFIASERDRLSRSQFKRLYYAEWEDWNDLPVYDFDRERNVSDAVQLQPSIPLDLSVDFNVDPMCWIVGQHHGEQAWDADEIIVAGNARTDVAAREFVRRYGDIRRDVNVFGDATGRARDTRSHVDDYEIILDELRPHFRNVQVFVPAANPPVHRRIATVNARLLSASGLVRYQIHPRCERLITDRVKVKYVSGTRDISKKDKALTHASDAADYRLDWLYGRESDTPAVVGVPNYTSGPTLMTERY